MKMKFATSTLEGKIAVMERYRQGFDRILFTDIFSGCGEYKEHPTSPVWNWKDFDYNYPAEPKLVPWTFETFPRDINIFIRDNKRGMARPCYFNQEYVWFVTGKFTYQHLADHCEHSLDNGKTWQPCGTYES